MVNHPIKSVSIFYRADNQRALVWKTKILNILKKENILITEREPDCVIVLGGDGTILEAAKKIKNVKTAVFGMNLGHVGFLASVRKEKDFILAIKKLTKGEYQINSRILLKSRVIRNKKEIFTSEALNEISIQSILGVVKLKVKINNYNIQQIRGTGLLISTPTGSTGYNLSAHGPIVAPDLDCMILGEIMDHNLPTPSMVIKNTDLISIVVEDFREKKIFLVNKKPADVILTADGDSIFPLFSKDVIEISQAEHKINFLEIEKNYFLKSIQEKFGFN